MSPDITPLSLGVMEAVSVHCTSLSLQERYYMNYCDMHFLVLVDHIFTSHLLVAGNAHRVSSDDLGDVLSTMLIRRPILRAILCGFTGVAPRAAAHNPINLASQVPCEIKNDTLCAVCISCFWLW